MKRTQPRRLPKLSALLPLLLLPTQFLLFSLVCSGCKAGDVLSSASSSSASVDNSTDDHSVTGSTHCTLTVSVTPENGLCTYTRDCDGATVEAGEFPASSSGECVLPTPTPEPSAVAPAADTSSGDNTNLNQSSAL